MKKKVSLKDIAEKVGVSTALVSYVLNNQKINRINKTVAQKIKDTARELNYRTNQIARSLKTNRTNTIGLIVADIANPFSANLARIIEDEAEKFGYTVIFGSSDESTGRFQRLLEVMTNHRVDGLIIAPVDGVEEDIRSLLAENEAPLVLLDRYYPGLPASHVAIDNYAAAYQLISHLIKQGRKRIGIITYQSALFNLQQRRQGYLDSLKDNGLQAESELLREISLDNIRGEVEKAVTDLLALPQPADAIFFTANTLSLHGLKLLSQLPVRVPHDLAIVAFDQSDAADLFYAPLTHVKQPLRQMGKLAVETLMAAINKQPTLVQVNMPAEIVIRQSSAAN